MLLLGAIALALFVLPPRMGPGRGGFGIVIEGSGLFRRRAWH
jgi:hypothetical protein